MVLSSSDLQLRLSGGATNSDATASLGGVLSSQAVSSTTLHNVFDKITGDESNAGDTEYRIVYVRNGGSQTAENVRVYLSGNYDSGVQPSGLANDISIGVSTAKNTAASTLTNESTAPTGVTFSQVSTRAASLDFGDLDSSDYRALYLRREIGPNASAEDEATFEITIEADSAE